MGSAGPIDVEVADVFAVEEAVSDVVEVEVDEGLDDVELIEVDEVKVGAVLDIDEAVNEDEIVEDKMVKDAPEGSGAQISERSPASLKESFTSLALTSNLAICSCVASPIYDAENNLKGPVVPF